MRAAHAYANGSGSSLLVKIVVAAAPFVGAVGAWYVSNLSEAIRSLQEEVVRLESARREQDNVIYAIKESQSKSDKVSDDLYRVERKAQESATERAQIMRDLGSLGQKFAEVETQFAAAKTDAKRVEDHIMDIIQRELSNAQVWRELAKDNRDKIEKLMVDVGVLKQKTDK